MRSSLLDAVVVSTDDHEIAEIARQAGALAISEAGSLGARRYSWH